MDIPRPSMARQRRIRRIVYSTPGLVILVGVSVGLPRLKPAAPRVDRGTIWSDKVRRGPMLRQVRGLGTLVPEEIRWIPALNEGRVERSKHADRTIHLFYGMVVKEESEALQQPA